MSYGVTLCNVCERSLGSCCMQWSTVFWIRTMRPLWPMGSRDPISKRLRGHHLLIELIHVIIKIYFYFSQWAHDSTREWQITGESEIQWASKRHILVRDTSLASSIFVSKARCHMRLIIQMPPPSRTVFIMLNLNCVVHCVQSMDRKHHRFSTVSCTCK
jgi:hypothetical protein